MGGRSCRGAVAPQMPLVCCAKQRAAGAKQGNAGDPWMVERPNSPYPGETRRLGGRRKPGRGGEGSGRAILIFHFANTKTGGKRGKAIFHFANKKKVMFHFVNTKHDKFGHFFPPSAARSPPKFKFENHAPEIFSHPTPKKSPEF